MIFFLMKRGSEFQRRVDEGYKELRCWCLLHQGTTKLKGRRGDFAGIKSNWLETAGYSSGREILLNISTYASRNTINVIWFYKNFSNVCGSLYQLIDFIQCAVVYFPNRRQITSLVPVQELFKIQILLRQCILSKIQPSSYRRQFKLLKVTRFD